MARAAKSLPAATPALPFDRRLAGGLVWLIVVCVPFLFDRSIQEAFRLPKLVTTEGLALASILLLSLAWARRRLPDPGRDLTFSVLGVFAPLLAAAAVGLLTSSHPAHVRQSFAALAIALAATAAWSLGFDRGRLERLLVWTVLPGVGLALVGLGQYHEWFQPFAFETVKEGTRLAVTSLAGNAGEFGGFLLLPALVAQWRIVADPARRIGWIAALAVLVYGQIASQTLTALAALLAGSAVFWLQAVPARRRGLVVGGTVAATLVVALAAPPVRNRIAAVSDGLTVGRLNAVLSGRLDGWRVAGHLVHEHPFVGVGLGGFAPEFAPARLALQAAGVPFFQGHREAFFANAHNEYLEWAAETGGVGVAALGWALWTLGRALWRWPRGRDRAFALATGSSLTLLALAYFPFRVPLLSYPLLVFLAWALRAASEPAAEVAP